MKKSLYLTMVLGGGLLWSQASEQRPIFRVSSDQVVVEFIAVDKSGRFVTDLKPEELELRVDGKQVNIERLIPPGSTAAGASIATPGETSVRAEAERQLPADQTAPTASKSASSAARTVILLDTRVLDAGNFSHSIRAIRRFVDEHLRSGHLVMLAEIDRGLKVATPFTDDRSELLAAVDSLRPSSVYNPLDPSRLRENLGERYFEDLQQQVLYLRSGLKLLCQSLSGFPGRKHVVFFSEGYPLKAIKDLQIFSRLETAFEGADERQEASRTVGSRTDTDVLPMVREVVALANAYGVSFYTVDARGLVALPGAGSADVTADFAAGPGEPVEERVQHSKSGAAETGLTEVQVAIFQLTNLNSLDDAQNTLVALAAGTNGSAFYNSNDLEAVMHASTQEQELAYVLSFEPKQKGKPKFHNLKIKSSRQDVIIRSQVGYQDVTEQELTNLRLATALERPDLFQYLSPVIEFQPNTGNRQVIVGVAGDRITGRRQGETYQIEVVFVGQIFDEKGNRLSKKPDIVKGFKVNVPAEQFAGLAQQPLLAGEELKLKPGKYRLVLVVMDQVSGTMGVREQEFRIS